MTRKGQPPQSGDVRLEKVSLTEEAAERTRGASLTRAPCPVFLDAYRAQSTQAVRLVPSASCTGWFCELQRRPSRSLLLACSFHRSGWHCGQRKSTLNPERVIHHTSCPSKRRSRLQAHHSTSPSRSLGRGEEEGRGQSSTACCSGGKTAGKPELLSVQFFVTHGL